MQLRHAGFVFLALALPATAFLSGCARRGGLEAPPSAAVVTEEAPAARTSVPDRRFILDGLI